MTSNVHVQAVSEQPSLGSGKPQRRRWSLTGASLNTMGILVFIFLYLPIVIVLLFSFNQGSRIGQWEGFSLRWYNELFQDRNIGDALEVTLWVSTLSMIISTVLGTVAALAMERFKFPGKLLFDGVLYLPVIIPDIVMAISLLLFFTSMGIHLSRYTILLGHVVFNVAYVVVVVRARLASMDPNLEEAAADLYARPWQTFWRVTFPQLMPGILSGALLAFTLSFDEFVVTSFINGQGDTTLPVKIYSMVRYGLKPEINAIATLVLLTSSALVVISLVLQGSAARSSASGSKRSSASTISGL